MAVHTPINGTTARPWRSSRRSLTLLEQLRGCQGAWSPGGSWDREEAHAAIRGTPAGSFLVVRDSETPGSSLLCVSAGGDHEGVLDYNITSTGTVFQLSESRLTFCDLAQLVLFYSLTRDVLAVCLLIPRWIYRVADKNKELLSQLEPRTWLCTPPDQQTDEMSHSEPGNMLCSIQLTSTNGALCVINPLYLREHGDEWLHRTPAVQSAVQQPSSYKRDRRLSTTRKWAGAGIQSKRAMSLDQESSAACVDSSGLTRVKSADSQSTAAGVVLRRPSKDSASTFPDTSSTAPASSPPSSPGSSSDATFEMPPTHDSPVPQSPHRVSWIEDGVWLPPPRPSSQLQLPSLELDTLSISSIEEDQDSPSPTSYHVSAHRLADKVLNRLSAVGQVLGGLVCPKKRLINRVQELSEKKGGPFAEAVKGFEEKVLKGGNNPDGLSGSEYLQEVRSSLTSLREKLMDYQDIQIHLDSITDLNDLEIDSLVELAVHKVALKPVASHLYSSIHNSHTHDGSFTRLQSNLRVLENKEMEELGGSEGVGVPDSVTLERIQQKWASIHEAYSPNKKVQILLKVCKNIYHSMSANASSGTVFGADDFLPCLTWVLLRSDVVTLQVDTDYMMELLDPTQLQGEGGYYLTTLYAALYYISSFQPRVAARQLSVEAQNSLNQWHRRRTLHCDQSRRRKHRQTIRRQTCRDRPAQRRAGSEETNEKDSDPVSVDESQPQVDSTAENEQPSGGQGAAGDQSETSTAASDCNQQDVIMSKTLSTAEEQDHGGL